MPCNPLLLNESGETPSLHCRASTMSCTRIHPFHPKNQHPPATTTDFVFKSKQPLVVLTAIHAGGALHALVPFLSALGNDSRLSWAEVSPSLLRAWP